MRHAKSVPAHEAATDFDRPLASNTREGIASQARTLVELGWSPEFVYVSDAKRTRETAELFVPYFNKLPTVEFTHKLYMASPGQIISYLLKQSPSAKTLGVIAHNPAMESLVEHLAMEFQEFKPASIALLEHSAQDWEDALQESGSWKLVQFLSAT